MQVRCVVEDAVMPIQVLFDMVMCLTSRVISIQDPMRSFDDFALLDADCTMLDHCSDNSAPNQVVYPTITSMPHSSSSHDATKQSGNNDDDDYDDDGRLLIDNTQTIYHSLRLPCGVPVSCQPAVLGACCCPLLLDCLNQDVQECLRILPNSVHALVRRTRIWVNMT
jgi:hypothetical protein